MMRDYVSIGCAPPGEDCVQLGSENYDSRAHEECRRFVALLRKTFGDEPAGARLRVKSCPHDAGVYLDVICEYDDNMPAAMEYAFKCESDTPEYWEDK